MIRSRAHVIAIVTAALLSGVALGTQACAKPSASYGPGNAPVEQLPSAEVRQYQGKDLSSIADFRENSIKGPQQVDRATYRLNVSGMVGKPLSLTYGEVLARPVYRKVVRLDCVEGWGVDILWEGVLVRDIIAQARPKPGASTVVLRAADGYSTSFPLSYFTERDILLAAKMNGLELPPARGFPFQVVAEDKWGYKWIKWVTSVELTDDPSFRGYWESRGYSKTGDRSKGPFDE